MKNLLFCAHIDWGFAKIVWWKTCYFVSTLIDVLPKLWGKKLVILPSQNKWAKDEANLQFASSQSKLFLWQQRTDEWQTNLLAKIHKWLAYILDDIVDDKLYCLHLYNTRDCTKRGVKSTVYNTIGRLRRIIHCVLACLLARLSLPSPCHVAHVRKCVWVVSLLLLLLAIWWWWWRWWWWMWWVLRICLFGVVSLWVLLSFVCRFVVLLFCFCLRVEEEEEAVGCCKS